MDSSSLSRLLDAISQLPHRDTHGPSIRGPPGPIIRLHVFATDRKSDYYLAYQHATLRGAAIGYNVDRLSISWGLFLAGAAADPASNRQFGYQIDPQWTDREAFSVPEIRRAWRQHGRQIDVAPYY